MEAINSMLSTAVDDDDNAPARGGGGAGAGRRAPHRRPRGGPGLGGDAGGPKVRQPPHVHHIGLTATPSARALALFGVKEPFLRRRCGGGGAGRGGGRGGGGGGSESSEEEEEQWGVRLRPFHAYTLQQALADGVVLDVLRCAGGGGGGGWWW